MAVPTVSDRSRVTSRALVTALRAVVVGIIVMAVPAVVDITARAATTTDAPGTATGISQLGTWGGLDRVLRISYLTTDPRGAVVPASGIVRLPDGPRPADGWRIISWGHGTSGLGPECGLTDSTDLSRGTAPAVEALNRAGYAVVSTDYLGLGPDSSRVHPYLHSRSEATAVIDIVRAARAVVGGLSRTWAVGGTSQGGHAALAAGHYARRYAPELDFRGTVALAPASNFENVIPLMRPGIVALPKAMSGPFAAILAGMADNQREVDVRSYLSDFGKRVVDEVGRSCGPQWESILAGARPDKLLSKSLGDNDFRQAIASYMKVPVTGQAGPVLIVHGLRDVTVPIPMTYALLSELRKAGTGYDFETVNADHTDLRAKGGMDDAIRFLERVIPAR
ncbi:alpha/beta fold hydrolase [Gordonia sp. ABSL11-1]|uniref:lipase family protein n=1 Tax=Gordonia sp. ABSL11-1 TaxID=3053924 RepID=UPI002573E3F6|nr:lipase family protein [Gordonia sp. ABSL11-1]MDL9947025.1 alpha/beta fold hydrolase [Gordonia sp. ABSL11-1]